VGIEGSVARFFEVTAVSRALAYWRFETAGIVDVSRPGRLLWRRDALLQRRWSIARAPAGFLAIRSEMASETEAPPKPMVAENG